MHYSIFVVLVRLFQCSSELKSHLCFWSSPAAGTSQSTLVCYPIGPAIFYLQSNLYVTLYFRDFSEFDDAGFDAQTSIKSTRVLVLCGVVIVCV